MFLKNIKLKSLAFISILLFPLATWAVPGAYISGEVGGVVVGADNDVGGIFGNGFAGRAALGYLWGGNNFNYGLESGLLIYPNADGNELFSNNKITYDGYNIDLLGVLKYTFDSGFALFGKAGVAYLHQKSSGTLTAFPTNISVSTVSSTIAPELAGGVGYQFNPNIETDLTLSGAFGGSSSTTDVNGIGGGVVSLMLGLTYHFG